MLSLHRTARLRVIAACMLEVCFVPAGNCTWQSQPCEPQQTTYTGPARQRTIGLGSWSTAAPNTASESGSHARSTARSAARESGCARTLSLTPRPSPLTTLPSMSCALSAEFHAHSSSLLLPLQVA